MGLSAVAVTGRARVSALFCAAFCAALLAVPAARAGGGTYVFDGGTPADHAQVRAALDASSFDWSLVRTTVAIHIGSFPYPHATPGDIWLDARLVRAGVFSWALIQDEYAHQIDFFLLDDMQRTFLNSVLGGRVWCHADLPGLPHADYGCERFTSTFVWAYWPTRDNVYRPLTAADESAALPAHEFRALLDSLLAPPRPRLVRSLDEV